MSELIGVKTDCPHFSAIGNLCARIENGMVRCDEYLECEFKYFDALKEENAKLKNKNNDLIEEIASRNIDIAILQKDLELFRKAHDNEQAQRRIFEAKLEKIKEYALRRMTGLACRHILEIIEGAEDEK